MARLRAARAALIVLDEADYRRLTGDARVNDFLAVARRRAATSPPGAGGDRLAAGPTPIGLPRRPRDPRGSRCASSTAASSRDVLACRRWRSRSACSAWPPVLLGPGARAAQRVAAARTPRTDTAPDRRRRRCRRRRAVDLRWRACSAAGYGLAVQRRACRGRQSAELPLDDGPRAAGHRDWPCCAPPSSAPERWRRGRRSDAGGTVTCVRRAAAGIGEHCGLGRSRRRSPLRRRAWLLARVGALALARRAGVRRPRSCCRATSAPTPTRASSGGTSPARWTPGASDPYGFQVTFFRRCAPTSQPTDAAPCGRASSCSPTPALTDPVAGSAVHDQRIARTGFGIADGELSSNIDLRLRDWTLRRGAGAERRHHCYRTRVVASDFGGPDRSTRPSRCCCRATGRVAQGPDPADTSHYLSRTPARGPRHARRRRPRAPGHRPWPGSTHEWADALLPPDAVGWDWLGINSTTAAR